MVEQIPQKLMNGSPPKLSNDRVIIIRRLSEAGVPQQKIAKGLQVPQSTISKIVNRVIYRSVHE